MGAAPRPGRFETQVRLVLILIVLLLAVLDLANVILLSRARATAERAERERAKTRGREAALVLTAEALVAPAGSPERERLTPPSLGRLALRFDLARIAILDPAGKEIAASGDAPVYAARFGDLDASAREALRAGRAVASEMAPRSGGEGALLAAFVPVLDASGTVATIVEVQQAVPEIGWLQSAFRLLVAAQAAGVVVIGVVAMFFGRWVSRPYRKIAAAAGEAGITPRGAAERADPDDLASAFRAVADKLREQEDALGALGREGGGLADLVRFAGNAATGMATGIMVVERKGRIAVANPAAESLLGLATGRARGAELGVLAATAQPLADLVRKCLDEGRSVSREVLEARGARGRLGHLGVTISPVAGPRGDVQGALVLMTDLTEIRQVQEQVRLRENLAAVGQLSAGIAHEFRNALGTILGYAKMLEKRDDPRVHGPAREILREVDAVRAQIDEFLLFARPPEPQWSAVPLETLIRGCASSPPAGITVEVSGEFGTVTGDEGLLKRVFVNLLQNAADIGSEAGRPLAVRITGRRVAASLQVEVEDDGPGIPPDRRAQVFVPFYTTRARGTGLGLALVQRTIVDLGGTVEAAEGTRGGALFRLRFPTVTNRDTSSGRTEHEARTGALPDS
ncbi:MAG TPA: ATP-binding protein [Candidatus Polarisedimenticolaceae bacterium]|nr:ATP-binding protein [Candidatus Polarisedimenticolaceae bacterium]